MWDKVIKLISAYDSFLITTHINPDGDAIGSEIALKLFLEDLDKQVTIVNASATPTGLGFLDPDGEIKTYPGDLHKSFLEDIDVVFILDVNNWEHIGSMAKPLRGSSNPRVCIDHHEGDNGEFADVYVNDTTAASAGILIYDLILKMNGRITRSIADAIYATVITDTGTFRFSNTDERAFMVAAGLYRCGADPFRLHRQVFGNKTWGAGKLMGPVLGTVKATADGRLAWIYATQDMMKNAGATYDDCDGFVDLVRAIKDVELVLFFKEVSDRVIKVSLRSNGRVNAYAIAQSYGGGGHKMASGMKVEGPMTKAIEKVVAACLQMEWIKNLPE